jgi:hypothetical protein
LLCPPLDVEPSVATAPIDAVRPRFVHPVAFFFSTKRRGNTHTHTERERKKKKKKNIFVQREYILHWLLFLLQVFSVLCRLVPCILNNLPRTRALGKRSVD